MAKYKTTLKTKTGDILYPQTSADIVNTSANKSVETVLNEISTDVNGIKTKTQHDLGWYATLSALKSAHPTGVAGDHAIVGEDDKVYVWDVETNNWKNTGATTVSGIVTINGKSGEEVTLTTNDIEGTAGGKSQSITEHLTDIYGAIDDIEDTLPIKLEGTVDNPIILDVDVTKLGKYTLTGYFKFDSEDTENRQVVGTTDMLCIQYDDKPTIKSIRLAMLGVYTFGTTYKSLSTIMKYPSCFEVFISYNKNTGVKTVTPQLYDYMCSPTSASDLSSNTSSRRIALPVNNTYEYTPTRDYHPATKKYVDDAIADIPTGDDPIEEFYEKYPQFITSDGQRMCIEKYASGEGGKTVDDEYVTDPFVADFLNNLIDLKQSDGYYPRIPVSLEDKTFCDVLEVLNGCDGLIISENGKIKQYRVNEDNFITSVNEEIWNDAFSSKSVSKCIDIAKYMDNLCYLYEWVDGYVDEDGEFNYPTDAIKVWTLGAIVGETYDKDSALYRDILEPTVWYFKDMAYFDTDMNLFPYTETKWAKIISANDTDNTFYVDFTIDDDQTIYRIAGVEGGVITKTKVGHLTERTAIGDFFYVNDQFKDSDGNPMYMNWVVGKSITDLEVQQYLQNLFTYLSGLNSNGKYYYPFSSDMWAVVGNTTGDLQNPASMKLTYTLNEQSAYYEITYDATSGVFVKSERKWLTDKPAGGNPTLTENTDIRTLATGTYDIPKDITLTTSSYSSTSLRVKYGQLHIDAESSKYEYYGMYYDTTSTWRWSWVNASFNAQSRNISRRTVSDITGMVQTYAGMMPQSDSADALYYLLGARSYSSSSGYYGQSKACANITVENGKYLKQGNKYMPIMNTTTNVSNKIFASTGNFAEGDWKDTSTLGLVSSTSATTIWSGTQADYDLITTKDNNTIYIITE